MSAIKLLFIAVICIVLDESKGCRYGCNIEACETSRNQVKGAAFMISGNNQDYQQSKNQEVFIVMGKPKSGKSTLVDFVANENSDLEAIPDGEGGYYINNNNPPTFLPSNVFIPMKNEDSDGQIYYVTPSLENTGNSSVDIASGYYRKILIDDSCTVKILLTVPQSNFQSVDDTEYVSSLLIYVSQFLYNMSKFDKSIALIVTIVENDGRTDSEVKAEVVSYLKSLPICDKCIYGTVKENYDLLIESLTYENADGDYDRIGLFREPFQTGTLDLDTELQSTKEYLLEVINNNIDFANAEVRDTRFVIFDFDIPKICEYYLTKGLQLLGAALKFFD